MNVVILGATGLVGTALIKKCLIDDRIRKIILITRRPVEIQSSKIEEIQIKDLSDLAQLKIEANLFFCAIGTTIKIAKTKENFLKVDYQAVIDFAKICQSNPAAHFALVSAKGANEKSPIFYNRTKGLVEIEVRKILSNQKIFIFRPGLLLGQRSEKRFLEEAGIQFISAITTVTPKSWMRSIATDVDCLATFMLKASLEENVSKIYDAEEIKNEKN